MHTISQQTISIVAVINHGIDPVNSANPMINALPPPILPYNTTQPSSSHKPPGYFPSLRIFCTARTITSLSSL